MYDPQGHEMVPLTPELAAKFAGPVEELTPVEREQRTWTRFHEGQRLLIEGVPMYVHEIGERRMVLRFVP